MLALCRPEAMLQAKSQRSMASLGKSGSVAPALHTCKFDKGKDRTFVLLSLPS
jgi:hypothetical protein